MKLANVFLNEKVILAFILINALIIFLMGFDISMLERKGLSFLDNTVTILFIIELAVKIKSYGFKKYLSNNWNVFDFILIVISIPSLIAYMGNVELGSLTFLLVFRVLRVFKSFRFIKFIPGIDHLITGVTNALKTSILVLLGFMVYVFIIGILSFYLFKGFSPSYFGNPLTALYSIFKIFTVEGWYEIPDTITASMSKVGSFFTYAYFIFVVISGGIFGFSLVNSIFVDAMVSDNNVVLEKKVDALEQKIDLLLKQQQK